MKKLTQHKDLLYELVRTDVKLRYSGSVLGFLWVFLKPFLTFLVIILVFSFFFSSQDPHYRLNVLIGIVFFTYFSEGTSRGLTALLDKSNLILKVKFPRYLAVIASLLHSLVNFLVMLIVALGIWGLLRAGEYAHPSLGGTLIFLSSIIILTLLILGFSLIFSVLFVRFRDLNSIWGVLLQLLMYLTPILYPLSILPTRLQILFMLNPLTILIDSARVGLIGGTGLVPFWLVLGIGGLSIILVFYAFHYFSRSMGRIAEYL